MGPHGAAVHAPPENRPGCTNAESADERELPGKASATRLRVLQSRPSMTLIIFRIILSYEDFVGRALTNYRPIDILKCDDD